MNNRYKIGGASLNQIPMDWEHNVANIIAAIRQAKSENIKLLCLPELCITGYGCEDMFLSDWLFEKAQIKLKDIIQETDGIAIAVGLPVIHENLRFNTTWFIENREVLGIYAKQKLANDGVHYEPRWFQEWPSGKVSHYDYNNQQIPFGHISIAWKDLNIGFEICEDAWRIDRPALHEYYQNIDIFLNPSASHFAFGKADFRENLIIDSSKIFNCVYVYANLLGNEAGRMIYDGDILIAQSGSLIGKNKRLSFEDYNLLATTIDFTDPKLSIKQLVDDDHNINREFTKAASLALFDYCRKSKSKGFVLSLSGGADSSSIAILVAESVKRGLQELGFEKFKTKIGLSLKEGSWREIVQQFFHTAYQGTKNSSEDTLKSAKYLAESIGANFYHWNIDEEVNAYQKSMENALGRSITWETDDIALQNIQARARSPIIWMMANIQNCLLLTTSNRSEGDVGYATMDGDTSGSISPIAAVDKHFILNWLKYAELTLEHEGLAPVNALTPTAELRPKEMNQTDEDDLMPYDVLVAIEKLAIRDRKSPTQVYLTLREQSFDNEMLITWISKFFRLWSINQWKRERIAPSFHLDDFNVDPRTWCRFPILSSGFKEELLELQANYGTGS
ncbi:MAG: NAD(+) synthase [Cyclobacteriaceae bacterium]